MEEETTEKTSDPNPEDLQGTSELRVKLEDERIALDVTIRNQMRRTSDLKREEQLLQAENEALDKDIKQKQKEKSEMSCFLSGNQVAIMINAERTKLRIRQRALQEQLEQYRLAFDACCQDLDERQMDIEHLKHSRKEYLTIIQELRTKRNDLDLQLFVHLEKAMESGGPDVDMPIPKEKELGQLAHLNQQLVQKLLLVIPEEEEEEEEEPIAHEVEEEKKEGPSLNVNVQTKSWLRRQADSLWKVVRGMGNFCLAIMRCQGLRKCMRRVIRSNQVHPVCNEMLPV